MFNESQSQELLSHMEKCKSGQQTILKFPEEKYLKFREVVKKKEWKFPFFCLNYPTHQTNGKIGIVSYGIV